MKDLDRRILAILQADCTVPVAEIAQQVGLGTTACWRRIQKLEQAGVIRARVALLDAVQVGVGLTVFVQLSTTQHNVAWLQAFHALCAQIPEVIEVYRMSGSVDYQLRVVVPDIAGYDQIYKRLIQLPGLSDVTSSFAMEQVKSTTALPLDYAVK